MRDPSKHADKFPQSDRLEVVAGDATDRASLDAALAGARGVIFAASGSGYWSADPVDHRGVVNTAAAAKAAGGVERVVLVSSMLTDPANRWHPVRILLNNIRYGLMDAKFKGEEALKASGVAWTVVRPGGLKNGPAGQVELKADRDVKKEVGMGSIARADVAAICVEALTNADAAGHKFSVYSPKNAPALAEGADYAAHVRALFAAAA